MLRPYDVLSLLPTVSCLQYGTQCFEGVKLFRGVDGKLRLFRPSLNAARMLESARRVGLPNFDPDEWVKLVAKLCTVDGPRWLPREPPTCGLLCKYWPLWREHVRQGH